MVESGGLLDAVKPRHLVLVSLVASWVHSSVAVIGKGRCLVADKHWHPHLDLVPM
jgi:hypothetical protein